LLDKLRGTLDATKAQVEKKQTLSAAELEADNEEDSDFIASESDDDDDTNDPVNNPLRLPLGFDGKPIPYWLYKLHGLNLEFTCEICGNYSYWGRRAYERHFKEARHQHGMRCLKIPNTKAFAEVRAGQEGRVVFPNPPGTFFFRERNRKSVFSRIRA
jgi:splicing factor 3A subunit 3